MRNIEKAVPGVDGITNGAVSVVVGGEQEDQHLIQVELKGVDVASLGSMVPLDPRGARVLARFLLEAADAAEDNHATG